LNTDKETLLGTMCGQILPSKMRAKAAKPVEDGLSVYTLSKMPPERQVEAVVRHLVVLSYGKQLRKRLPPSTMRTHGKDEELLKLLRRCANLVAGNWVLKSELAGYEGYEAFARDLLLMLLSHKNGILTGDEMNKWAQAVNSKGNLSQKVLDEIARAVCVRSANDGSMRLRVPPDDDFRAKFPKIVTEFETWWERHRTEQLTRLAGRNSALTHRGGSAQAAAAAAALRQRSKLVGDIRECLAQGAMTMAELRRHVQKRHTTTVVTEEEIQQILSQNDMEVVKVRDLYVSGRTGNESNDRLRSVMHGIFRARDAVTSQDILDEFESIHGHPCKVSSYVLRNFLRELADRTEGDTWVLKGLLGQGSAP